MHWMCSYKGRDLFCTEIATVIQGALVPLEEQWEYGANSGHLRNVYINRHKIIGLY